MSGIRGAPRRQLIIHHVTRFVQFLAWFFKTKLDNMSRCAALYHSLAEERIGHGKGRNSILLFQKQGMASSSDTLNSCSVSHAECDGNTQFQGFLLEQTVNSEFRAVLTLFTSYAAGASGYSDVFHLLVVGLVGFQTHQCCAGVSCCLLGSHGRAYFSAQGQEPPAGLEPAFGTLTLPTVHILLLQNLQM